MNYRKGLTGLVAIGLAVAFVAYTDATAATIEGAGGKVFFPAMTVMTAGRMGVFADPSGALEDATRRAALCA